MLARLHIAVCILAGGKSRRFGDIKAFADWDGQPLIAHILGRIRSQTDGPVAINADEPTLFSEFGAPVLVDQGWYGAGPLTGIRTALQWAKNLGLPEVATVGVDLPFLPADYLQTLEELAAPAIASSNGRWHPINGLWDTKKLSELESYLEFGKRSAHGWSELCEVSVAEYPMRVNGVDPFFNVNTVEDLQVARALNGLSEK